MHSRPMPVILSILAGTITLLAAIVVAGVSGLTFYIWPTGLHDQQLNVTPDVIQRLRSLQSEHKFGPDPARFYPGATHEDIRAAAQASVDATLQAIITELPARPQRSTVLRAMKLALADFDTIESEERDRILDYFTKTLDICGVDNSGELFNVWRYGFPYGWL